jgi:hypothetical protein
LFGVPGWLRPQQVRARLRQSPDLRYVYGEHDLAQSKLPRESLVERPEMTRGPLVCSARIGIDITNALPTVTYPSTTCTMCQSSFGALGQRTYYNNPTSAECQEYCQNDASCESFDYDRTRSLCRTYEACPPSSQSKRYGCQWTLYQKPGFERPTSPIDAGNIASNSVTTSSEGPHGLENKAVASAALPTLRRSSREQAFLLAAILIVHRWLH